MKTRNSRVELLKLFGILCIVASHMVQSLHLENPYLASTAYRMEISTATTDFQHLLLAMTAYGGAFGNTLFFVCSAWFLLDSRGASGKKFLRLIADVWVVSVSVLLVVLLLRHGDVDRGMALLQLAPNLFENNWYITCYLLFYLIHPFLNRIIRSTGRETLLRIVLAMSAVYLGINFLREGMLYSTNLMLWMTIYFLIAYIKRELPELRKNRKFQWCLLLTGVLGNMGLILVTNFLGLRTEYFRSELLRWVSNSNPFLVMAALGLFLMANSREYTRGWINSAAGLSLLIYLFHENMLLKVYYRPLLWQAVHDRFGYDAILLWAALLTLLVFALSMAISALYRATVQKVTAKCCDRLYPRICAVYRRLENRILKLK